MTEPSAQRPVPGPPRPVPGGRPPIIGGQHPAPAAQHPAPAAQHPAPAAQHPESSAPARATDPAGQVVSADDRFSDLARQPVAEHVAAFEAEHARLQRELGTIDQL